MTKRLKYPPRGTPIIIHWFDAHAQISNTGSSHELTTTNCELQDIGFYVGHKGRFVTIAVEMDADGDDHFRHTHHFPKVNIIRIEVLSESRNQDSKPVLQAPTGDSNRGDNVLEGAE